MSARDDVLARVRAAQSGTPTTIARAYRPPGSVAVDVDRFVERLLDYKAEVRRCPEAQIATTVRALLAGGSVVLPEGVPPAWAEGSQVSIDEPRLSTDSLDRIDAVVTRCAVGIAETATIVLDHGPGQGRRALTLVPDHHIVVISVDQIVASVPDAIAALPPGTVQTWTSGPSATSDIELNRVEGVHGPRRLSVVVVAG